jgi:uncharacterized protein (TIGR03083 family)
MTAADRDPLVLPSGLRERVLAASLQARDAGRPVPDAPEISAVEAFSRAASAFYALLCVLDGDQWRTPVLRDLDVQGLVGHLIGVEHDVHRALAGDPDVADANHVESTQAAAVGQAAYPPARTRAEWRRAADRTLDLAQGAQGAQGAQAARGTQGARVALYGLRLPVSTLLVVRAFELWTHENDIRQAVGWEPSVPDPSTLRLMTDLAARLLPRAGAALPGPVDVRLVLTGPGGGTWDVTVGGGSVGSGNVGGGSVGSGSVGSGPSAGTALSIVTDAVGFCRLAANRVVPAELDVTVTGDPGLAAAVLAAATTLALD